MPKDVQLYWFDKTQNNSNSLLWLSDWGSKYALLISFEHVEIHLLFGRTIWTQNLQQEDLNWFQGPGLEPLSDFFSLRLSDQDLSSLLFVWLSHCVFFYWASKKNHPVYMLNRMILNNSATKNQPQNLDQTSAVSIPSELKQCQQQAAAWSE